MALNFKQNGVAPTGWVPLVVFLAISIACVTVYAREGENGPLHSVQGAFETLSAPLSLAGSSVGSAASGVVSSVQDLAADESTLSGLKEQNAELRELVTQTEEYRQEVERLQALLGMKTSSGVEGVGARVIGRSEGAWSQSVTIDVGKSSGIDVGMTVMGASGVVGQVISTSESTSVVRLLTDPQSGVAVIVQSNRAEGIVRGSLEGVLYLEDIDSDVQVSVGDIVVTSGLGGSYVRGLIVGTVVKVDQRQGEGLRSIVIAPNDATGPLEEVLVVTSTSAKSDLESASASDTTAGGSTR